MGPPGGRPPAAAAEERHPQPSAHRATSSRVPTVPPDEHTPFVTSNSPYPSNVPLNTGISTYPSNVPPNTGISPHPLNVQPNTGIPPPPSQQRHRQQQHYEEQQHTQWQQQHEQLNQQTFNNSDPSHQHFSHQNPPLRDPLPLHEDLLSDTASYNSPERNIPETPGQVDDTDGPGLSRAGIRTNVRVNVSTEQEVCDSTPDILKSFIVDRMEYDGYKAPPGLSTRGKKNESAIAVVLRKMGDDISQNYQLNHYISEIQVTPNTAYKTFASVACQIFTDGNINWGRVVMLFYFAYKLALQVLNQLPLIDIIIGWVTQFVSERIASWISSQGGWNAIREYYGSTTGQMVGVFLAGILVSTLFWYWRK